MTDFSLPLASALLAAFSAAVLLARRTAPLRSRGMLAALLGLFAGYGWGCHLTMTAGFAGLPHLSRVGSTLSLGFMPLLYLYARGLAAPERRLGLRDLVHGIPFLCQGLIRLPFFLLSGAEKVALTHGGHLDRLVNRTAVLALGLVYLGAVIRLWRGHERWLNETQSRLEGRHLTWILWLHGVWTLISVGELLWAWGVEVPGLGMAVPLATVLTAFLGLTQSESEAGRPPEEAVTEACEAGSPAAEGPIAGARESEVLSRVLALMDREPLHLDPDLSLADLAGRLRLPPSYVSRALNQGLGQNFFTFINQRRVAEASRLLREAPERTVLEIGLACGFASKSTFNAAFKKATGLTPTAWRRQGEGARIGVLTS